MHKGYEEEIFLRNGQKSSLHCWRQSIKKSGDIIEAHFHNYYEILYGVNCNITIWIDDTPESFHTGDLCFINPNQTHFMRAEKDENQYLVIKFSPDILRYDGQMLSEMNQLFLTLYNDKNTCHVLPATYLDDDCIKQIFYDVFKEWDAEDTGYEFAIRGQILRLFSQLLRIRQTETPGNTHISANDETTTAILTTVNYIMEHYDVITEQEAAAFSHLSYSYFSRMFKKIMGKSFSQFITGVRIDAAKKHLLNDSLTVTEIAEEIGFSSASHLIASFKRETGLTPHQYRMHLRDLYQKREE